MKVKFISTQGDYLEAVIEVNEFKLRLMDEFSGSSISSGEEIDLEIEVGLHYDDEEWDSMFSGNPKKEKKLEHQSSWSYRAYGIITSINPMIVDCGILKLEGPVSTNDINIIGESIAFTVDRLQAC